MITTKVLWTLALALLLSEEDVNQSKKKKEEMFVVCLNCLLGQTGNKTRPPHKHDNSEGLFTEIGK